MTDSDGGAPDPKVAPFANPGRKGKGPASLPPGNPKPPPGAGKDTEGLAAGYWREDESIWTTTGPKRNPRPIGY
jgi:hypothetical protein